MRVCGLPVFSSRPICASLMPSSCSRLRAAPAGPEWFPPRCNSRYSACAAAQSGTSSSTNGWSLATGSSGARAYSFSTKPPERACTTNTARSFHATLPTASMRRSTDPVVAAAVRTPRFCATRGSMTTVPSPAASSAYFGTSCRYALARKRQQQLLKTLYTHARGLPVGVKTAQLGLVHSPRFLGLRLGLLGKELLGREVPVLALLRFPWKVDAHHHGNHVGERRPALPVGDFQAPVRLLRVGRERGIRPGERLALSVDPLLRMLVQVGKERSGRMVEHARVRRIGERPGGLVLKPRGERVARALDGAVLLDDSVLRGHSRATQREGVGRVLPARGDRR